MPGTQQQDHVVIESKAGAGCRPPPSCRAVLRHAPAAARPQCRCTSAACWAVHAAFPPRRGNVYCLAPSSSSRPPAVARPLGRSCSAGLPSPACQARPAKPGLPCPACQAWPAHKQCIGYKYLITNQVLAPTCTWACLAGLVINIIQ